MLRLSYSQFALVSLLALISLYSARLVGWPTYSQEPATPYTGPVQALNPDAQHGFLSLQIAQDFCHRHRWEVYTARDRKRKVYDLFLINTELDWAEIRFNELSEEVDYFVVLESAQTFQETAKPLHFKDSWPNFTYFHNKIIHRVVNFTDANLPQGDTWEHERFTRNTLFDQALFSLSGDQAPVDGDVLIVGDVDEMPRLSTLTALRSCAYPPRVTLRSHFYYYSFQWLHRGDQWPHPQATFFKGIESTVKPEDLRTGKPNSELYNAAWHCSSCMSTLQGLMNKITSFSHKAYNHPYILDPPKLLQKVRNGEDLFERKGEIFDRVEKNMDLPSYLLLEENRQRFAYMLDRDPPNANFHDQTG